jgi:hypothetical protein
MYPYSEPSPFPPSFDGSPLAYGFGLFGDVVATALALTLLLSYVFEERRHRTVNRMLGNPVGRPKTRTWSPLFLYRASIMSLLTFVVLRALPDAVWMLAWGEVPESTIRALLVADLVCDGLALGPLFFAVLCWCWGRQVIPQMLVTELRQGVTGGPPWDVLWKNGRIVGVVLIIAIGVTIGKASG